MAMIAMTNLTRLPEGGFCAQRLERINHSA
jgi:hypothetical protein